MGWTARLGPLEVEVAAAVTKVPPPLQANLSLQVSHCTAAGKVSAEEGEFDFAAVAAWEVVEEAL